LTGRPLHGSGRAGLPHPALVSGDNAEPTQRISGSPGTGTSSAPGCSSGLIVAEVSFHHRSEPPPYLGDAVMHSPFQLGLDPDQLRRPREHRRMTRGRRGTLTLQRMTLSFTTPCRFSPAQQRNWTWLSKPAKTTHRARASPVAWRQRFACSRPRDPPGTTSSRRGTTRFAMKTGESRKKAKRGPRIDMALSHSGSRRLRGRTVIRFGLRRDERSLLELARMLEDRSARVRPAALGWYAGRIHPDRSATEPHAIGTSAGKSPPGIERLLERMPDEKFNVRRAAVLAVGAYRDAGDPCVAQALQSALDDPKHKVAHAAARILGMPCPGCGRTW